MNLKPAQVAVIIAVLAIVLGLTLIPSSTIFVDEVVHHPVSQSFCHFNPEISPNLTNIPAYHALMGGICAVGSWLLPLDSLAAIRTISLVFSLLGVYVFYLLAVELKDKQPAIKTLQFFFLPIALPFYFLVYTDIPALTIVLLALLLTLKKKYALAGLVATLSVAFRQNNIVWLLWLGWMAYLQEVGWKITLHQLWQYGLKMWTFALGMMGFAAFIYFNGGISLAKAEEWAHPIFSLRLGNIYLMLLMFALIFWPLELEVWQKLKKIPSYLPRTALGVVASALLFVPYLLNFENSHPYNQHTFALHNLILVKMTASLTNQLLAFIPIAIGVMILFLAQLKSKKYLWFYLFAVLFVLPSWLIEPRYFFLPFALFILFRKKVSSRANWRFLIWEVVLAILLFGGTVTERIFP